MDNIKILLSQSNSKSGTSSPSYLDIALKQDRKIFNGTQIQGTINANDIYNQERKKCNKIRLTCEVNAVCTNALFNPVTEIVKNEGSEDAFCLNYTTLKNSSILGKSGNRPIKYVVRGDSLNNDDFVWNEYEAVRDTQLSSNDYGYVYHCGSDIFNNHLLRSNSFKIVSYNSNNSLKKYGNGIRSIDEKINSHYYLTDTFNTIDDWMRDSQGIRIANSFFNPFEDNRYITYSLSLMFNEYKRVSDKSYIGYYTITATIRDPYEFITHGDYNVQLTNYTISVQFDDGSDSKLETMIYGVPSLSVQSPKGTFSFTSSTTVCSFKMSTTSYYDKKIKNITLVPSSSIVLAINAPDFNDYHTTVESVYIDKKTNSKYNIIYLPDQNASPDSWRIASHLYQSYEVDSFDDALGSKLIESNGWFGFANSSKMPSYDNATGRKLDISKPINSEITGNFIDMYPSRDLLSFAPKFNPYRKRMEKNWDYCITYPSTSTTDVSFISSTTGGLKARCFDEYVVNDNGVNVITIYSIAQHGLKEGDYVNIYNGSELVYSNASVVSVYDKYIFQINKGNVTLSKDWYGFSGYTNNYLPSTFSSSTSDYTSMTYTKSLTDDMSYTDTNGYTYYVTPDTHRINLDKNCLDISFKRVVSNVECKYYVRIFSKLPNFKFADKEVNEYNLYGNGSTMINDYSTYDNDFSSHVNNLAFAKNIYNDKIGEIVFTDDIDLTALKDNLGRPLSDIYLTIVKRNAGYKKWYGINKANYDLGSEDVEYSHCFGKNSCAFLLSSDAVNMNNMADARTIGYGMNQGLNMAEINTDYINRNGDDEIVFENDKNFYGDLCCYSPVDVDEESIQPIFNRFNTAQRELTTNDTSFSAFSSVTIDDVTLNETTFGYFDDYDQKHSTQETRIVLPRKEGYYYKSHYKIPVKTVSLNLSTSDPLLNNVSIIANTDNNMLRITAKNDIYYNIGHKCILYKKSTNEAYILKVNTLIGAKTFTCNVYDDKGNLITLNDITNASDYVVVDKDDTVPDYAVMSKDGSCQFKWREILANGFDYDSTVEQYPFTNGALYVNRFINLYLRRQDPHNDFGMKIDITQDTSNISYEPDGEELPEVYNDNSFVSSNNMKEC